jgi:hypothetical protein
MMTRSKTAAKTAAPLPPMLPPMLHEEILAEATKLARSNSDRKVTTRDIRTAALLSFTGDKATTIALAAAAVSRISGREYTAQDILIGLKVAFPDKVRMSQCPSCCAMGHGFTSANGYCDPCSRQAAATPTAPTRLDFSKKPKKPVSAPIAKSTEQQLADALAENEKFRETVNRLVDTHNAQKDEIAALKKELARYSNPHSRYVGIDFSS